MKSEALLKRRLDMLQLTLHSIELTLPPDRVAKIRAQIAEREAQLQEQHALKDAHTLAVKRQSFSDTFGRQMRALETKIERNEIEQLELAGSRGASGVDVERSIEVQARSAVPQLPALASGSMPFTISAPVRQQGRGR